LQLHGPDVAVGVVTFGVGVIEANIVGVGLGRLVGLAVGVFVAVAFVAVAEAVTEPVAAFFEAVAVTVGEVLD